MEKDLYDTVGSRFSLRVENHIEKLEKEGRKARTCSYIVIPESGIWRRIGHRTFYRLYGLHYFTKSDELKTAGIQKAIDSAKSRIFIKDGTFLITAGIAVKQGIELEGETMGKCIIRANAAFSAPYNAIINLGLVSINAGQGPFGVRRMTLDMNGQTVAVPVGQGSLTQYSLNDVVLKDLILMGASANASYGGINGNYLRLDASDIKIYGSTAQSYSNIDVQTVKSMLRNIYINSGKNGLHHNGSTDTTMIGVIADSPSNNGFDLESTNQTVDGLYYDECVALNFGNNGFVLGPQAASSGQVAQNLYCINCKSISTLSNTTGVAVGGVAGTTGKYIRWLGGRVQAPFLVFLGGGFSAANDILILNASGYNPQGFATTTPAMPTSGTAQANNNPYPAIVYLYGGTVTQITINGQVVFSSGTGISLTGQSFTLNPGDTIAITYSVAPTWKWYGL